MIAEVIKQLFFFKFTLINILWFEIWIRGLPVHNLWYKVYTQIVNQQIEIQIKNQPNFKTFTKLKNVRWGIIIGYRVVYSIINSRYYYYVLFVIKNNENQ